MLMNNIAMEFVNATAFETQTFLFFSSYPPWQDDCTSAVSCIPLLKASPSYMSGIGLPTDARSDDVSKFFEGYGRIIDCRVMTGSF